MTKSGFPSPSKSPIAMLLGLTSVTKSTRDAKEIVPLILLFLYIETVLELVFTIASRACRLLPNRLLQFHQENFLLQNQF